MGYRVGDFVTVRHDLKETLYNYVEAVHEMMQYKGRRARIINVDSDGDCKLCIDGGTWYWSHDMLER